MRPVLLLPLLAPALLAQVYTRGVVSAPSPRVPDPEALIRKAEPRGLVVTLGAAMEKGVRPVLGDPRLAPWGLRSLELEPEDGALEALRRREGWEAVDRWALLDRKGRVLASGTQVPHAEDLLKALEEGGLSSLKSRLETFLRLHPEHGEARMALLDLEARAAWAGLQPLLQAKEAGQPPAMKAPLTEAEAERLFGPTVSALETLLRRGTWKAGQGGGVRRLQVRGLAFATSLYPQIKALLPLVEAELARHPAHPEVWGLWRTLAQACGASDRLAGLVARLTPTPDIPGFRKTFPPEALIPQLTAHLKAAQDWAGLRRLLAPCWTRLQVTVLKVSGDAALWAQEETRPWEDTVGPLVEAHLRLGDEPAATQVVEGVLAWSRSPRYPALASELARRLDRPDLAARWAVLPLPAPDAPRSLAELARRRGGDACQWVLVEDGQGEVAQAFQAARRGLGRQQVPLAVITWAPGGKADPLAEVAHVALGRQPGWALLDPEGRVLAHDTRPATVQTLGAAQSAAGLVAPLPRLEAFLKQHPDHEEARVLQAKLAMEAGAEALGAYLKGAAPRYVTDDDRELAQPLTPEADARCFAEAAAALRACFQGEGPRLDGRALRWALTPVGRHSALLRSVAREALPRLEAWIVDDPGDENLWALWVSLNRWDGGRRSAVALWQRCAWVPGVSATVLDEPLKALGRELRQARRWSDLVEILDPLKDTRLQTLAFRMHNWPDTGDEAGAAVWEVLGPLVEAHLRLGEEGRATALVEALHASSRSATLIRQASTLALACGKAELARAWAGLEASRRKGGEVLTLGK